MRQKIGQSELAPEQDPWTFSRFFGACIFPRVEFIPFFLDHFSVCVCKFCSISFVLSLLKMFSLDTDPAAASLHCKKDISEIFWPRIVGLKDSEIQTKRWMSNKIQGEGNFLQTKKQEEDKCRAWKPSWRLQFAAFRFHDRNWSLVFSREESYGSCHVASIRKSHFAWVLPTKGLLEHAAEVYIMQLWKLQSKQ